jgi:peptide/nickel transport system permease protein
MTSVPVPTPAAPSLGATAGRRVPDWPEPVQRRRRSVGLIAGVVLFLVIAVLAVAGPWIAPHDPLAQDLTQRYLPPAWMNGGTTSHLLGTDQLGRDELSRIIGGARISMGIALGAMLIGGLLGTVLGLVTGFFGRTLDTVVGRLGDVQQALPLMILCLAVITAIGQSLPKITIVVGLSSWLVFYRVIRAEVLSVRQELYIDASTVVGRTRPSTLLRHVVPNVSSSIIVVATLYIPSAIMIEASLSFLGVGVPLPLPSWGSMISEGTSRLGDQWWLSVFPGIALVVAVLSVNLLGDALRDRLDPASRVR